MASGTSKSIGHVPYFEADFDAGALTLQLYNWCRFKSA